MRLNFRISCILFSMAVLPGLSPRARAQDATEIIRKADDLMRGKSSYAVFTMTIEKPSWKRTMTMKAWSLEPDFSLVYVTEPARDKGTVTLKRGNEVWNWLPSVQKVIKIPPSMMLQSWMGSDFTNDDLVRASSIVKDYTHRLLGRERYEGQECYKIELVPKPEAGVVWAKVLVWISTEGYLEYKTEYYDEDGTLVKSFLGSNVKKFGDRRLPAHWEMVPYNEPGNRTILEYDELRFDEQIGNDFFSLQNMKRVH
ncbi:MAG TPA: outer membrane lipoprotein-sorting protein [Bacteroidota bacterium]|nr:outer membrane lipoprotein-sorting protein [Bacteroidota bacterium]